ncbi:MAG: galactose mutarotase [Rikenellaceae bacterium]|nr:galactose mutarotase [Rikenellaceae bacterium]
MKKLFLIPLTVVIFACGRGHKTPNQVELISPYDFHIHLDGKHVGLYTIENQNGMTVQLTNYGARIVALWVPDAEGNFRDVVFGYDNISGYRSATEDNTGPVVGRYGNRIAEGRFTIDGKEYRLEQNNNGNNLHGGSTGFAYQVWDARETSVEGNPAVVMSYRAADGEGGYPGNLDISVTYSITPDNRLVLQYEATSDAPTILNPTSHAYFNLHGTSKKSSLSHYLTINADSFTETDADLIPTGNIVPLEGTPLDFRTPTIIGERIDDDYQALAFGAGYDHNFVLATGGDISVPAARVYEPSTGIVMTVYTDQPGIQFYSGNFMDGSNVGKRGDVFDHRTGIALEAQNFPDAPNHENFPTSIIRPGDIYTQTTIYGFGVE